LTALAAGIAVSVTRDHVTSGATSASDPALPSSRPQVQALTRETPAAGVAPAPAGSAAEPATQAGEALQQALEQAADAEKKPT
jgi:hypothetical protein